jgi:hypothetical protein
VTLESPAQAIESKSKSLYDKLITNQEVSSVIMAILGQLVIISSQQGKPIEGIVLGSPNWLGRSIRSKVAFNAVSIPSMGLWRGDDDMLRYARGRAAHLSKVFDKNPGVLKFFTTLIKEIDLFCTYKGIDFKDVKIEKAIITTDYVMIITLSKEHMGIWQR